MLDPRSSAVGALAIAGLTSLCALVTQSWAVQLAALLVCAALIATLLLVRRRAARLGRADDTGRPDVARQERDRLAALMAVIPDTLIRIDAEGRIRAIEDRSGFLDGEQELIGAVLWDRLGPAEARQRLMESAGRARETGALQVVEHTGPGTERCYELRLSGKDEVLLLVRDVTEARRLRAELHEASARLQAASEELREFAFVAAHDLQESLRVASSFADLLQRHYEPAFDARGRRWLQTMLGGIQRTRALIDDLLAYSRVGRIRRFAPVDAAALVRAVLDRMRASIEAAGAEIHAGDLPVVVANQPELEQVFQNLLDNALKFRRAGVAPRIDVTAARAEQGWVFTVADNGIGIEPAYHERIFRMFQRLHGREQYPGTGIGLPLVKKIVERHGGTVSVRSTPGEGTEIRFTIPDMAPPDSETDAPA
jgi:signal transduction histidine kinase